MMRAKKRTYTNPKAPDERRRALRLLQGGLSHDRVMPKARGECENDLRPCPWIRCRHHLYADISKTGSLVVRRPDVEVWDMEHTCSLDLAERGGMTLEEVGALFGESRERARQVEARALEKLANTNPQLRKLIDDRR